MKSKLSLAKSRILAISFALIVSLSTTACSGWKESPSSASVLLSVLTGQSSETLTESERKEIRATIRSTYPEFPAPKPEAIQAIRELNDPAVNEWMQDLAILCRQLDPEC